MIILCEKCDLAINCDRVHLVIMLLLMRCMPLQTEILEGGSGDWVLLSPRKESVYNYYDHCHHIIDFFQGVDPWTLALDLPSALQ